MVLLLAWSKECLHEKENGKVYKGDLFNSFCGWFGKENAKREFFKWFFKKKIKTGRDTMVPVFLSNSSEVSNFFLRGSIRRRCNNTNTS